MSKEKRTEGLGAAFSQQVAAIMDSRALAPEAKAAAVLEVTGELEEKLQTVETAEKELYGYKGGMGILSRRAPGFGTTPKAVPKPAATGAAGYVQGLLEGKVAQASGAVNAGQLDSLRQDEDKDE